MRSFILTTSYPAYKNHIQSPFVHELASGLAKQKVKVDVVCPYYLESRKSEEIIDSVNVSRFKYFFPIKLQSLTSGGGIPSNIKKSYFARLQLPFFMLSMLLKSMKYAKDCDVIHAQWLLSGFVGTILKKIYKKPLILTTRGADFNLAAQNKLLQNIAINIIKNCDYITPNNDSQAIAISKLCKKAKVKTIPNGIDTRKFKPRSKLASRKELGLPLTNTIILFTGWLIERKGVKYLIDAVPKIVKNNPNTTVIIIGEGIEKENLVKRVKDLKISDSVRFVGAKSPDEIPIWMNASDVFILPSFSEGRPNVVGEALASGLPVIATKVNGTTELIENKKNGLLINPRSSEEIANSINLLLKDKKLIKKIKSNCRKSVLEKKLTWENCAKEYISIYDKVVKGC